MGLSSNILWHQTDRKGFDAILKSKCLTCSYALETFKEYEDKMAFPIICLSDIPLADIGEYLEQYGGYSLGFSRKWVIDNGFNPVWYCEESNQATKAHNDLRVLEQIKNSLKRIMQRKYGEYETNDIVAEQLDDLLIKYRAYQKNIEGPLEVKSRNIRYENYRFYDEREYRYFPDSKLLKEKGLKQYLSENEYIVYKSKYGSGRVAITKEFSWNDLKIIIVETDEEVVRYKELLNKYNPHSSFNIFTHKEIKQTVIGTGHQIISR